MVMVSEDEYIFTYSPYETEQIAKDLRIMIHEDGALSCKICKKSDKPWKDRKYYSYFSMKSHLDQDHSFWAKLADIFGCCIKN